MLRSVADAQTPAAQLSKRVVAALLPFVFLSGCATHPAKEPFEKLAAEFLYTGLSYSPVSATAVGYHNHNGIELDTLLDDYSEQAINAQRRWTQDFRLRLERSVDPGQLSPDDRADFEMLENQISQSLLETGTIQNYRHNPTQYVELIGSALYSPYMLHYASAGTRFRHIIARLERTPLFVGQAQHNLVDSPEVWNRVAQQENEGNIALIDQDLRQAVPPGQRAAYDLAAVRALASLRSFNKWLKDDLSERTADWRLGPELYAKKFYYALDANQSPSAILAKAEAELKATRHQMYELALPIYQQAHPSEKGNANLNAVVSEVLTKIAQKRAGPDTFFTDAKRDLEETTQFVKEKDPLTLPSQGNLQVIETPEFMRGIYSVGGFSPAPALQPELGAFYWITPIPKDWPPTRVESKLREYNFYGLKILTTHEAMPGHYVQAEYANQVQPALRRSLRSVYSSGSYVEGWAVYATELMLDLGYLNNDPALRLTFQKHMLRVLGNTILDIRLQTMGMTDQEALDLMTHDTFQETEEATGKLQRAKLSSTQLPTYYVGFLGWHKLRENYIATKGSSLKDFHEAALKAGAVPLPILSRLLTGKSL